MGVCQSGRGVRDKGQGTRDKQETEICNTSPLVLYNVLSRPKQEGNMSERVQVEMVTLESRALAGNPLGDPAVRELPVLLPPGYDSSGSRRYPVLYGLTGFTGSGLQ